MIDKLAYDKSFRDVDFYRREYEKALSYLQPMSSGVPYGRVELNEVETLKREMKRMQAKYQKELTQLNRQMDAITAAWSEIDMMMNLRIDDSEVRTFFIAKMDAMILFHSD